MAMAGSPRLLILLWPLSQKSGVVLTSEHAAEREDKEVDRLLAPAEDTW